MFYFYEDQSTKGELRVAVKAVHDTRKFLNSRAMCNYDYDSYSIRIDSILSVLEVYPEKVEFSDERRVASTQMLYLQDYNREAVRVLRRLYDIPDVVDIFLSKLSEECRYLTGTSEKLGTLYPVAVGQVCVSLIKEVDSKGLVTYLDERERKITQKFGRFLSKHLEGLTQDALTLVSRLWQESLASIVKYKHHVVFDHIEDIYKMESAQSADFYTTDVMKSLYNSCMRHSFSSQTYHPAAAYNSGDFGCHYLVNENDPDKLYARCMVYYKNENEKYAGPIYGVTRGACSALEKFMLAEGIHPPSTDSVWDGAKLLNLPDNNSKNRVCAPYLDVDNCGVKRNDPDDKYMYICGYDDGRGNVTTSGHEGTQSVRIFCEHCHEDAGEITVVVDIVNGEAVTELWCEGCASDDASWVEYSRIYQCSYYSNEAFNVISEPYIDAVYGVRGSINEMTYLENEGGLNNVLYYSSSLLNTHKFKVAFSTNTPEVSTVYRYDDRSYILALQDDRIVCQNISQFLAQNPDEQLYLLRRFNNRSHTYCMMVTKEAFDHVFKDCTVRDSYYVSMTNRLNADYGDVCYVREIS